MINYTLKTKTIHIIGNGITQAAGMEFISVDDDVWTLNTYILPVTTLHWDIHPAWSIGRLTRFHKMSPWCGNPPFVVHPNNIDKIGDATVFDLNLCKEFFGVGYPYLSNGVCYQLAAGIYLGAEKIYLWGIDQTQDRVEAEWERPCIEFYIGFAQAKGINVAIPSQSFLLRTFQGGREHYPFFRRDVP